MIADNDSFVTSLSLINASQNACKESFSDKITLILNDSANANTTHWKWTLLYPAKELDTTTTSEATAKAAIAGVKWGKTLFKL